jgi:hypothetical protein
MSTAIARSLINPNSASNKRSATQAFQDDESSHKYTASAPGHRAMPKCASLDLNQLKRLQMQSQMTGQHTTPSVSSSQMQAEMQVCY